MGAEGWIEDGAVMQLVYHMCCASHYDGMRGF